MIFQNPPAGNHPSAPNSGVSGILYLAMAMASQSWKGMQLMQLASNVIVHQWGGLGVSINGGTPKWMVYI